jgi:hypothetical protein
MKEPDEMIERLFRSLRDAEPDPGFEQRILASWRNKQEDQSTALRWWPLRILWTPTPPAWSFSLVVLVVLGVTAGITYFLIGIRQHEQRAQLSGPQGVTTQQTPTGQAPAPVRLTGPSKRGVAGKRKRVPIEKAASGTEQVALRNVPAPPLPLTEQERLLQRIARRRNAGNLDLLDAERQNAEVSRSTLQFQRFFDMSAEEMRSQLE